MRKQYVLLILVLAFVTLLFWRRTYRPENHVAQNPNVTETNQARLPPTPTPRSTANAPSILPSASAPTTATDFTARNEQRLKQMQADREHAMDDWRTPIAFYGKVVDQTTNAVPNAQVDFGCNDLSKDGTSNYHTNSDGNGLFSITGIAGKLLSVNVTKAGYYSSKQDNAYFTYAGANTNFTPDAQNPVVFYLRKKGLADPMIRFKKDFLIPKDGTPVEIDLTSSKMALEGTSVLRVESWTSDQGKRSGEQYDWKCRVSVIGGGIQPYSEEFPFSAPDSGYEASDEIDMTAKPAEEWQTDVTRHYFVRTQAGKFGRLVLRMLAGGAHFCVIESYFNPSGSSNLEYDPNNVLSGGN